MGNLRETKRYMLQVRVISTKDPVLKQLQIRQITKLIKYLVYPTPDILDSIKEYQLTTILIASKDRIYRTAEILSRRQDLEIKVKQY